MEFCEINYTEWRRWGYANQWGEGGVRRDLLKPATENGELYADVP